jgi:hypothetical protein
MKSLISIVLLSIFTIAPLTGQIIIDWTEIPQNTGIRFTHNGVDSVTVNLGSQGGPHTWQFVSQPTGEQDTDALIVPKNSTPFGDSFPGSNLVYMIYEDADTIYAYSRLAPSFGCNLGQGSVLGDTVFFHFEPVDTSPLPIVYGASRHYHYGYTMELDTNMELRSDNYGFETIDAWGMVIIPYDTFDCLRSCSFDTIIITLLVNGIPVTVDTTTHIIYDFLAEDVGIVVHVLSYEEETNPNYSNALFLSRLTYFSTGVYESRRFTVNDLSHQPNPFSDYVTINYCLSERNTVELKIYDSAGRLVKTAINTVQSSGQHTVKWYGRDDHGKSLSDGVYFYSLYVNGCCFTGKMLFTE